MSLNTEHLSNCIKTLSSSLEHLKKVTRGDIEYEIFRNATIKGFELTLETAGKLLRKTLKLYTGNPRAVDELTFKSVLRDSSKHGLMSSEAVERWFEYRDNRNNTAHDYGEAFAETTLKLIPNFIIDATDLEKLLKDKLGTKDA